MQAAGRGEVGLPTYTHTPPPHLRQHLQEWLDAHRVQEPTPCTANVVTRHYADNGVFGAVPELVRGLPELAAGCVGTKGLQYKAQWEGYSSTAKENIRADFTIHPPDAGMVLVGGGVGPLEPTVVLGAESYIRAHSENKVAELQDIAKKLKIEIKVKGTNKNKKKSDLYKEIKESLNL